MTVGDKIKKIRTFRGMTQKELGLAIGFEEKGADNRIAQYETNYRVPKRELLDKMAEADVVVLATPVYFYTMDAQMKVLIDRTVARYATLANKEFYFIATMADGDKALMERTFEGLRGFTDCLPGAVERGVVCGAGAWAKGDIEGSPAMDEAYEMGLRA